MAALRKQHLSRAFVPAVPSTHSAAPHCRSQSISSLLFVELPLRHHLLWALFLLTHRGTEKSLPSLRFHIYSISQYLTIVATLHFTLIKSSNPMFLSHWIWTLQRDGFFSRHGAGHRLRSLMVHRENDEGSGLTHAPAYPEHIWGQWVGSLSLSWRTLSYEMWTLLSELSLLFLRQDTYHVAQSQLCFKPCGMQTILLNIIIIIQCTWRASSPWFAPSSSLPLLMPQLPAIPPYFLSI